MIAGEKIKLFLFSIFLGYSLLINAQQESSFNMYMFNHQSFNAGYVGSKNYSSFTFLSRSQWIGFDGAPVTHSFSYNGSRSEKNLAFSLTGIVDRIGPIESSQFSADVAYQLKLNDKEHYLGLGLKLSASILDFNSDILAPQQKQDFSLYSNEMPENLEPNIGFGFYYHTPRFYLGFSIPRMIQDEKYFLIRHNYFITGGLLSVSNSIELKPSLLLKFTSGSPISYDFSTLIYFNKSIWVGPQIKNLVSISNDIIQSGAGLGVLAGIHVSNNFSVGYVFSNSVGIRNFTNTNSHEFLLRYEFNSKIGVLRSPRIF